MPKKAAEKPVKDEKHERSCIGASYDDVSGIATWEFEDGLESESISYTGFVAKCDTITFTTKKGE